MKPALRKALLVAHVTASVGWLGSIIAFLALGIAGLRETDPQTARAVYLALPLVARLAIVPLCGASLVSGLVQSLATPWGLFRHYWVVIKFAISVPSTLLLLLHLMPIDRMARFAAESAIAPGDHQRLRIQLVLDASLAIFALLVATALSVVKPRGLTKYGRRRQQVEAAAAPVRSAGPA